MINDVIWEEFSSSRNQFLLWVTRYYGYHGNFFVGETRWQNLSLELLNDLSPAERRTAESAMNS